jgi:uncharacterized protein (DUF1697 family)
MRAVNVGGTGKLPMSELVDMCADAGFTRARTYIASGNVVFESRSAERTVKNALESRLTAYAGKSVAVMIRTAAEMAAVLRSNPFPHAPPNRTVAIFLDEPPPRNTLSGITGRTVEEIQLGRRELYVHYGPKMADSKLKISVAKTGTARNLNTVAKLVEMAITPAAV